MPLLEPQRQPTSGSSSPSQSPPKGGHHTGSIISKLPAEVEIPADDNEKAGDDESGFLEVRTHHSGSPSQHVPRESVADEVNFVRRLDGGDLFIVKGKKRKSNQ